MKQIDNSIYSSAEEAIKNKDFEGALLRLQQVNTCALSQSELARYNLIFSEVSLNLGNYQIQDQLGKSIEYYKSSSDNQSFARSKLLQGWLFMCLGNNFDAKEALIESYTAFKRIDDLAGCSLALNRLAHIQLINGALEEAIYNLEKCITINEKRSRLDNVAVLKRNLALIFHKAGDLNKSISQHKQVLKDIELLAENHQYHFYMSYAMATALKGDIKKALQLISKTRQFPDDYKREKALYYEYLGWIYNLDEQYNKAVETLNTGIELSMKIAPESALISQSKRLLADALIGLGKIDEAEQAAREALVVAEKINERVEIAACHRVFAQVEQARGHAVKAREWYKKATDLFPIIKSRYELAVTRYLAACSGLYNADERSAMLYLAREYFESEDVRPYLERIDRVLVGIPRRLPAGHAGDNNRPMFIAADTKMKKIVELAEHVAPSAMTILLTGPTGTGKDQLANYIHHCSGRKGRFMNVNCAAIPDSIIESELFGHRRGAFTGSDRDCTGLFESADRGTLYLNEISSGSLAFQSKLLEVLETRRIRPIGGREWKPVDFRLIAATNDDLQHLMNENRFRRDLYYRLSQYTIEIPALDDRPDDIMSLARYFLEKRIPFDFEGDGNPGNFRGLCKHLRERNWPGNVRELENEINRLFLDSCGDLKKMLMILNKDNQTERELLHQTLEQTGWNQREAGRRLGLAESTVRKRIKKYKLTP